VILFLTNADTEILALRVAAEGMPAGFPTVRAANPTVLDGPPPLEGVRAVLVRLLGGRDAWRDPFDALRAECIRRHVPLLAFGGEAVADAELTAASTVPSATVQTAFAYLVQGGVRNLQQLLRFVAGTVLREDVGFEAPAEVPACGVFRDERHDPARPTVGVVFYRAHVLAGNTQFVDDLCDALDRAGANALAVYTYSLRPDAVGASTAATATTGPSPSPAGQVPAVELLRRGGVDAVITTTYAGGSFDEAGECWDAGALGTLGVPVIQAMCATGPSEAWEASSGGLSPLDVASAVAIPEFDGRIVSVAMSFKEHLDDDELLGAPVSAYRTRPDRVARVAELAVRHAQLRRLPPAAKKVAIVLSAYPTKRSRLGNAVGLDTPVSVVRLLTALRDAGYRVERVPASGDELMAELAATVADGSAAVAGAPVPPLGVLDGHEYSAWFATLPAALRGAVEGAWGAPPERFVFAGLDLGGVVVAIQPPRGFGEDPVAVYHSPDLAPLHQYLAFYRWLDRHWGAHAVVHVGKHGTLEWLPGKGVGLSAACAPDAALGSVPLVYPFVVNDPGEGTQAKRRAHAVVVDHLVPPLTRADAYDDLARLETLLDEHARLAALDPAKLPAVRRQVWDCLVAAEIHRDLGLGADGDGAGQRPPGFEDPAFDDLLLEVDGYLCELKDAQIRGGLHVLGRPPAGEAQLDLVAAVTRLPQGRVPSLRVAVADELGVDLVAGRRREVDAVEAECRRRLAACQAAGWRVEALAPHERAGAAGTVLAWVCERLVPALEATADEIDAVLGALAGRAVAPGPSGAPSRGQAHVLPTGRNFYSVDPKAIPSRLAWEVGRGLADRLVERHMVEEGRPPRHVGLVVWGTAAMRTAGDDVAEALALLGVRPVWAEESGRVEGLEVIELDELGRPRVDVTVRVSGFFRDAFPHVLALLDDAVRLVAAVDEGPDDNPIRAAGLRDPRVFGPKPGAYGSGILPLLDSRQWHGDEDLAAVYLAWGGWAYGRDAIGVEAGDALRRRLAGVEVAVKNQDNREHDIFDSDDYLQDHGGMVAAVRFLAGRPPKAYFGDSADPARPRVRSLAEEAARVVRSRVVNPKWIQSMRHHGYKGAFEMAATVDYLFGYDATAQVVEDWMYERVTAAYVADPEVRRFFEQSNPWALRAIAERLLEAVDRGMWHASEDAVATLRRALLEAEGWEEAR